MHAESFSTMNELSKTLQTKMLNLYQKKDQMQKQIDGLSFDPSKLRSKKSVQDLNERNSKQEEFDLQERKLTALQEQLEVLKEDKVKEERLNAQLGYGISALADRLGIEHQPSESIYIKMKKCNAKIKQLQKEQQALQKKGSLSKAGGASSTSVMSSANIRVKVPSETHSYAGSHHFPNSQSKAGDQSDGGSDSSEEEMFKRHRNNSRRR